MKIVALWMALGGIANQFLAERRRDHTILKTEIKKILFEKKYHHVIGCGEKLNIENAKQVSIVTCQYETGDNSNLVGCLNMI